MALACMALWLTLTHAHEVARVMNSLFLWHRPVPGAPHAGLCRQSCAIYAPVRGHDRIECVGHAGWYESLCIAPDKPVAVGSQSPPHAELHHVVARTVHALAADAAEAYASGHAANAPDGRGGGDAHAAAAPSVPAHQHSSNGTDLYPHMEVLLDPHAAENERTRRILVRHTCCCCLHHTSLRRGCVGCCLLHCAH